MDKYVAHGNWQKAQGKVEAACNRIKKARKALQKAQDEVEDAELALTEAAKERNAADVIRQSF
jgi:flagellar biosynthesis chaperone FliJ